MAKRLLWQPSNRHRVRVHPPADSAPEFLRVIVVVASAHKKRVRVPRVMLSRDQPSFVRNIRPAPDRFEIRVANERNVGGLKVILLEQENRARLRIAPPGSFSAQARVIRAARDSSIFGTRCRIMK
jgi:hypothetical protein